VATPDLLGAVLALVLAWEGLLNVVGPRFVREEFRRFGYPDGLRLGTGVLEWIAAIAIAIPSSRLVGCALGPCILIGVLGALLRAKEPFMRLEYPTVLLALTAVLAASG
jgi:hypothetical protein